MIIRSLLFIGLILVLPYCKTDSREDFSDDLEEKLNYALKNFKPTNKAFILNVVRRMNREVIFQIVHRSYAEQTRHKNDSFGFALHVAFPPQIRVMKAYEKFKTSSILSDFVFYKYEEISCYIADMEEDVEKIKSLTEKLLVEVYTFKDVDELFVEMTDEGEVKDWIQ